MGAQIEKTLFNLIFVTAIGIAILIWIIWDRIKLKKYLAADQDISLPLLISEEEFFKRFKEKTVGNKHTYCGYIEEGHAFRLHYYPWGRPSVWNSENISYNYLRIEGRIESGMLRYSVAKGVEGMTSRRYQAERDKLKRKLEELMAADY